MNKSVAVKVAVVAAVVVLVVVAIAAKGLRRGDGGPAGAAPPSARLPRLLDLGSASTETGPSATAGPSSGAGAVAAPAPQPPATTRSRPSTPGSADRPEPARAPSRVLATVNGKEITESDMDAALAGLAPDLRAEYSRDRVALLDELVVRQLLLQEARERGVDRTDEYRSALAGHDAHPGHEEHVLIDTLIGTHVAGGVTVTEADIRAFYDAHRDEIPGRPSFERARDMLEPYVRQEKEGQAIQQFIDRLREKARIVLNAEWVEEQKRAAAQNPLDRALASGLPVLADFGRGTCIPCKMMAPILEGLATELKGRAHVLVLDTGEYGFLARRHNIRLIPTQIFFGADGKELARHEGFMSREELLAEMERHGMIRGGR